jgi:DNA modification methylase/ParB-like chromosome segregation protein Spo0J
MLIIPRKSLAISARQRKEIPRASLLELRDSILETCLYHAPVAQQTAPDRFELVAGERRVRAIDLIAEEKKHFYFDKNLILPGNLPVVLLDEAINDIQKAEIELAENVVRLDLPWQDRIAALAYIHSIRKQQNPAQTLVETARAIIAEGTRELAGAQGGLAESTMLRNIKQATIINDHLDKPEIARARNATEAFNLIVSNEQRAFEAELIKRGQKKITTIEVRHGSLFDILPKLEPGIFDTILADPPYGIGVDTGGFRQRTVVHHNYDDSPDSARAVCSTILTEGFRICRARANLFIFCDIDLFGWLKESSARAGWDPFRTPITWIKSDSEGMAPWGREGFRRTTEWIFFARKGQKGLIHSPVDHLRFNRVARDDREYGPEKPVPLIRELLAASTLPGDYVLDPCCGSGSTLVAARELNMRALGIEADEKAYNLSLVKSQQKVAS